MKKLITIILIFLTPIITWGAVTVIDVIQPKNEAFRGLVDDDQIIDTAITLNNCLISDGTYFSSAPCPISIATSTNPLMASYFVATSTTQNTFNGGIIVSNTLPTIDWVDSDVGQDDFRIIADGSLFQILNTTDSVSYWFADSAHNMTFGSPSIPAFSFTTDGTGNAEIVLPNDSIGATELQDTGDFTMATLLMTASTTLQNFTALNSTTSQATTTSLAVLNLNAASCDVKSTTGGSLYCGTDATGGGGGASNSKWATSTDTISIYTNSATKIGVGTSSPGTILSLGDTGVNTININSTATSTFGSGIDLRTGCFSINGTCVGDGGAGGSSNWTDAGAYLTPLTSTDGILINSATSTITNLVMVNSTSTNATTTTLNISSLLKLGGATFDNLVGYGLQVNSGDLQASLGPSITVNELFSSDFGDWTCNGSACTVDANSVDLATDTTGNYAAGDAEAGAALTGDSATSFFSAGTLEVARGGTGSGSYVAGDLLVGNSSAGLTNLTVGSLGKVLTVDDNATTKISWQTPNVGTVTSVAATVPTGLSITGSPITTSGTLAISYDSNYGPIPLTASSTEWAKNAYSENCKNVEQITATDDNQPIISFFQAATVKKVGARCYGTCTTKADFLFQDDDGNRLTYASATPATRGIDVTFQDVTATNSFTVGEGFEFSVVNTPVPLTDTYSICYQYTYD